MVEKNIEEKVVLNPAEDQQTQAEKTEQEVKEAELKEIREGFNPAKGLPSAILS